MKHVISIGFEIPGDVVESVRFKFNSSLLDADLIVFSPEMGGYVVGPSYLGKSCLEDDDSARIQNDAKHWRKELEIALQAGKTVFAILAAASDVYVYTGKKDYSGTGRNARITRLVDLFDPYSSIPVPDLAEAVHRSTGQRIKTTKDIGVLASYWQEFGEVTCYTVYLDKNIGTPVLVTQTGEKMVGGVVRSKEWKGTLILLPPPLLEYLVEEREEQLAQKKSKARAGAKKTDEDGRSEPTQAEKSVGTQFVNALIEIDTVLRERAERTPTPAWAGSEDYALKDEVEFKNELSELESSIAELEKRKIEVEKKLISAGNLRGLVFETGKPLESSILGALRIIGFTAEGFSDDESQFDVVFTDPSAVRLLGEAEGKDAKAVNIDKLDQLERNIQEDFKKRTDSTVYAKGVLFGNAFRLSPPTERGDYFTPKCKAGAKRSGVALVRTPDLFTVAKFLKENSDPGFASDCRQAIIETNGDIVNFPAVPKSVLASASSKS